MESLINADFIMRVTLAVILGFCIGLERELTNKYAGLRTHILVALGACIFTLISIYGFPTYAPGDNLLIPQATGIRDTGRVAAQVVTGIGFIGAGTVLRNGPIILGLTTAATLWIAASIGMACGAGMYDIAFAGTSLAVLVLVMVRIFEKNVLPSSTKRNKVISVSIVCSNEFSQQVQDFIIENYTEISELKKRTMNNDSKNVKITCIIGVPDKNPIKDLYKAFDSLEEIESVSIKEFNE